MTCGIGLPRPRVTDFWAVSQVAKALVGVTVAAGAAAALSVGSAVFFAVDSIAPIAAFEKLVGLSVGSAFATRYLTLVSGNGLKTRC